MMPQTIKRAGHPIGIALVAVWLIVGGAVTIWADDKLRVEFAGRSIEIPSVEIDDVQYVSLTALVDVLGTRMTWDARHQTATFVLDGRNWEFRLYSPYVTVDGEVESLVLSPLIENGDLVVPIWPVARLLDRLGARSAEYDQGRHRFNLAPRGYSIVDYEVKPRANGLMIEIILTDQLKYEAYVSEGNWINVTIQDGRMDPAELSRKAVSYQLREVKAYQFEASAQLSFRFRTNPNKFRTLATRNPDRIQVIIDDPSFVPETPGITAEFEAAPNPIDVIVIDPGHGGHDDGAVGRKKKTKEKDVVLRISKELKKLLERDGFEVILTRSDDRFLPLTDRTKIANDAGADLFISVHANASKKSSPRGCQTFFLARALNDEARAAAMLENSALQYENQEEAEAPVNSVEHILLDMIQGEFQKESSDLADMIQTGFEGKLRIPSRGVDQAGFVVLNKAYMPAVLVETAFISNVQDEALLRKDSFRDDIAEAIRDGVRDFKAKYDRSERAQTDPSNR